MRGPASSRRMVDEDGRNQMGMTVELNQSFDFRKTNKVPVDFENQREISEDSDEDTPGQKTKSIKGSVLKFGRKSAKMLKLSETLKRPEESVPPLNKIKKRREKKCAFYYLLEDQPESSKTLKAFSKKKG